MDLLDPRPQRLAQLGGDHHGGEAAQQSRAGGMAEIEGEQLRLPRFTDFVVDGERGEIEQRGAEAGIFPIDQP